MKVDKEKNMFSGENTGLKNQARHNVNFASVLKKRPEMFLTSSRNIFYHLKYCIILNFNIVEKLVHPKIIP